MFKVDLHIHSLYSGDNDSDPEEIIERAIELGLDGIAFTEHYYYEASEGIAPLIDKYKNAITILRGVEFAAADGHCLVFGANIDRLSDRYITMNNLIKIVDPLGGVVIPAHPFRGMNSIGDLIFNLSGVLAIEGFNGCSMLAFNRKAIEAAGKLRIPFTGGSDSHSPAEVGSCYTIFHEPVSQDNIVTVLKSGKFTGRDNRRFARLISNLI